MTNIHIKPSIDWKKEFINLWGYFEYLFKHELEVIDHFEDLTQATEENAKKSTSSTTALALQKVKDRKI